jgi:3-hydroxybutyryl-CoA dehydrogenase
MTRSIHTIAVVGAGTMGRGIAYACCVAGYRTKLYDVNAAMLKSAKDYVSASLQKAVNKTLLSPEDAAKSIARLETTADFATAVNTSDFIIEAVPEKKVGRGVYEYGQNRK